MSHSKEKRKFIVPALYPSRFSCKISSFEKRPEVEEWLDWTFRATAATEEEFQLSKPIIAFVGLYYSNCEDIKLYEIVFKLFLSGTVWDDRAESDFKRIDYDEEKSLKIMNQTSKMLSKLENKEFVSMIDWDPSVTAMYASLDAIYAAFNETQKKRLISIWSDHVLGMIEEYRLVRQLKTFSSVEEMIKIRVDSCGMIPFIQMIEFSEQIYLPKQIRDDPRIYFLENLVTQHFCTLNDLISFDKDYRIAEGNLKTLNNTVAFFVIIKGCSIEDAMKEAKEMVKHLEEEITRIENELLNEENCLDVTKKYINSLNNMLGGNYQMIFSKRY